jgi:uncharacterized repeat protein (TIGR03803 family)
MMGRDGRLYGSIASRPNSAEPLIPRIFSITGSGEQPRDLKVFSWNQVSHSGVIQDQEGWLYGVTFPMNVAGGGNIFKLSTNGQSYTVLHEFGNIPNDGLSPGKLVIGTNGWLYGCTTHGGNDDRGTIFRLRRDGGGYQVLHRFDNSNAGGRNPIVHQPLLVGSDGYLYGAADGGTNRAGLLFRIGHDGSGFKSIHQFAGENGLGDSPIGGLLEWCDGALYGTTVEGGIDGAGMVFKVDKDGRNFTPLKVYIDTPNPGDSDGTPRVPLVLGMDHQLYGITSGGTAAQGTLFRINLLPALEVQQIGTDVLLAWPDCAGQFVLQHTTNVRDQASWQPVNAVQQTIGTERRVLLPSNKSYEFYRLVRP